MSQFGSENMKDTPSSQSRPAWHKPVLTEAGVPEATQFTRNKPVDDGARQFGPNYATYGIGS